jgi:hypothetical protein
MGAVEVLSVDAIEVSHAPRQIAFRALEQEVVVVRHQAIGRYAQIPGFRGSPEEFNKAYVVPLVLEDGFTPAATVHGMIPCIRVFDSQRSGHILI